MITPRAFQIKKGDRITAFAAEPNARLRKSTERFFEATKLLIIIFVQSIRVFSHYKVKQC
jgi:hypothetical protein